MVDGAFFDVLAHVASTLRQSDKPFGGIQLGKASNRGN
jgi:hypothetical protein